VNSTIEISIIPPRNYTRSKDLIYAKFYSRLDAEDYTPEDRFKNYTLLPHVDYDVRRKGQKYYRVYKRKTIIKF
jgi:hypothetical protein